MGIARVCGVTKRRQILAEYADGFDDYPRIS